MGQKLTAIFFLALVFTQVTHGRSRVGQAPDHLSTSEPNEEGDETSTDETKNEEKRSNEIATGYEIINCLVITLII